MYEDVTADSLRACGLSEPAAIQLVARLRALSSTADAAEAWDRASRSILTPDVPFAAHALIHQSAYATWDAAQGPPPAWRPSRADIERANLTALGRSLGLESYAELYRWSCENRDQFWKRVIDALAVRFVTPPSRILELRPDAEHAEWLVGARLNIAESCFLERGERPAAVYQAEGGNIRTVTYAELSTLSNRVANGFSALGLTKGTPIAIAMPMTVESVAAYLGAVRAGCVVVSIADSFSPDEIGRRLRISGAHWVVTQDVILRGGKTIPMYERVVAGGAGAAIVIPAAGVLRVSLRESDRTWPAFLSENASFAAVTCSPSDTLNILFSSGTTGDPKAIPWTHLTPIKCAADGYLHQDIKRGDVVAWPTNLGWMMGPWLIFATLMNRGTMALYYGAPGTREFCAFVQDAKVRMLGVVPSLVKAWRQSGAAQGLDWSAIKVFSSTGEASNPEDYLYLMSLARYRPVIEYCGGTEIGGGYITGTVVQSASPGTFSTESMGLSLYVLDDDGREARNGEVFLVPPSIGLSSTLLNRDHHEVYYEGTPEGPRGETLRRHGDQMERIGGGYFRAHGRADDTMNLGGIKVSSAEIERTVSAVAGVVETAAVAVSPPEGGPSRLVVFAVPERSAPDKAALLRAMQRAIAENLNPLFKIHDVVVIDALPRTASNKVMRRVLRDRYAGVPAP
jgi:acetyl-CoA synthetase